MRNMVKFYRNPNINRLSKNRKKSLMDFPSQYSMTGSYTKVIIIMENIVALGMNCILMVILSLVLLRKGLSKAMEHITGLAIIKCILDNGMVACHMELVFILVKINMRVASLMGLSMDLERKYLQMATDILVNFV